MSFNMNTSSSNNYTSQLCYAPWQGNDIMNLENANEKGACFSLLPGLAC